MNWKVLKSDEVISVGFFRLRRDQCELPDGRINDHYYVMEFADWVNIVPVTSEGMMVLVKQYRHGAGAAFLEIPGGSTDGRNNEDPKVAGERELLEETGYKPREMIYCGYHYPNPALQNNRMHTFLALGCEKVADQSLDPFEDLTVELKSVADVFGMWMRGELRHSLIFASLGLAMPHLQKAGFKIYGQ